MVLYYLSLGANTAGPWGTPDQTLAWARQRLTNLGAFRASAVITTAPMHRQGQPDYTNQVVSLRSPSSPTTLLALLAQIESEGGRQRAGELRYGPRSLDIDVLLAADLVISSPWLTVPHPRMHMRPFVLGPLCELDPSLTDPRNGRAWQRYLSALEE